MRYETEQAQVRRVLIYRLGSIGDTVVALPAIRLVARAFPEAERRVLTNFSTEVKAAPLESVLEGTGLLHSYMRYPLGERNIGTLYKLRSEIRNWGPDVLVYLAAPRGRMKAVRDLLFFRSCGIGKMIGIPLSHDSQGPRQIDGARLYESEASRLARGIRALGDAQLQDPASWDLALTSEEIQKAENVIANWSGRGRFIAASIGTKADTKDWGVENWRSLFSSVSRSHPGFGLVTIGAANERAASDIAADAWSGPKLNLCGNLKPRESAAVIQRSVMFIGHDSGPMHLAAAVNIPCVAVFSARNKPGEWFPFGTNNQIIYHQTDCFGCQLERCEHHQKKCIRSITVDEVRAAVAHTLHHQLGSSNHAMSEPRR